jgi:hypothetical protein
MVSMDKINLAVLLRSIRLMGKLIRRFSLDDIKHRRLFVRSILCILPYIITKRRSIISNRYPY